MLKNLKISFCRRIVYLNYQTKQQLSIKTDKKVKKSEKLNSANQAKVTFGYTEFNRDTRSLSSIRLRSVTEAKSEAKKEKFLKALLLDFEPDAILENETTPIKSVVPPEEKKKEKRNELKKDDQKEHAVKGLASSKIKEKPFKPIVYKPVKLSVPPTATATDEMANSETPQTQVQKLTELRRKEIEEELEKRREATNQKAAERCIKTFENFRVNEDFLENMLKYPLITENLLPDDFSGNFYDETELKMAGDKLFEDINPENRHSPYSSQFPAVTTVLNVVMPADKQKNLIKWQVDKIEKLGFDGFNIFKEQIMKNGSQFHRAVEAVLKKKPVVDEILRENENIIKSVKAIQIVLEKEFNNEMILIEDKVFHDGLFYKGRLDCLGQYKDSVCVIDWKRSDKPKKTLQSLYDAPIQTSAYIGAFLNDSKFRAVREKHKIKNALIVNVSEAGEINFHMLNYQQVEFYWYQWLSLLRTFWYYVLQQRKN